MIEELSQRDLRILSIFFISCMEHDWNDWFDGSDGMTGESEEYCEDLYKRLRFIFDYLGEEGKEKFIKELKNI